MSSADHEKKYVATYKELAITFVVFCIILIVLYPKDILKEQILSEKSNYDLSMLYLKNMLKNDPENESLMLNLATQSLRSGKKDLAYKLLELLKNSKDTDIRSESFSLSYKLAKEDYFYFEFMKNEEKKEEYYKKLQVLFKKITRQEVYNQESAKYLFGESIFLHDTQDAYKYALKNKNKKSEIKELESVYYLTLELHKTDEAMQCVNDLIKLDKSHKKKWRNAIYFLIIKNYSKEDAEIILTAKAKESTFWTEKLAQYKVKLKEYIAASNLYMQLFDEEKNSKVKKSYFYKAISALNAGKRSKKAVVLASRYEEYYFHDREMRQYILRLYLANGSLKRAAALSKKILVRKP